MTEKTYELPILVLRGMCILPNVMTSFSVSRKSSLLAIDIAMNTNQLLFIVTQKNGEVEEPQTEDLYEYGVLVEVKQVAKMPDQTLRVLVDTQHKVHFFDVAMNKDGCLQGKGEVVEDKQLTLEPSTEEAYLRFLKEILMKYNAVTDGFSPEKKRFILNCKSLRTLVYETSETMTMPYEKKQALLEAADVLEKYELLTGIIENEIEVDTIKLDLKSKVQAAVEQNQKEYILREQQKVIREELGEDDLVSDSDQFLEQLTLLEASDEVKDNIRKEIKRFKGLPSNAAESSMVRGYLETVLDMPWDHVSVDNEDLKNAKKVLDADHYGLEKVKDRMLEFLAVRTLTHAKGNSPIICLVGPPGVGKTSIARSVARALNKQYIRMSLGGVRDEAEIRGHRRTYIGAMPGRIAAGLRQAGTKNPLMLLDEIDKLGNDYKGDPSSALLEVLDSEQNIHFRDHYIEIPLDLSEVLFIATANNVQNIPEPLLDRMELIEVTSYTANEKVHIATEHLISKQMKANGLKKGTLTISKKAVMAIIEGYTKESGVRGLERKISEICRKAARQIVEDQAEKIRVTEKNLTDFLGKPLYVQDVIDLTPQVGVVTGLAWTTVGGDTLEVEVNIMEGKGDISLTGQLGDVMKESAQAGLSYVRSVAGHYGIDSKYFNEHDIHIHVPEGAVPKDGPSAGITMATAMISAMTNIPVQPRLAMTGEITLRGRVLPIGGLKEKILAAKQFGIRKIIVPGENQRNVEDISQEITHGIEIIYVKQMEEVLHHALVREPQAVSTKK